MKILLLSFLLGAGSIAMAQTQIVTTGNNVMDASNPYAADVVIGSDAAGGTRHDSSIMWWSNGSASRISTTGNTFNFSAWSAPQTPNISLSSVIGGSSYMMGNLGIGTQNPNERLVVNGNLKVILDQANFPGKNVTGIVALGYSGITGAQNWALRGVYQHGFGVGNNADGGDLDLIKSWNGNTILATKTDGTGLGYVGIGTTAPNAKLDIAGNMALQSAIINTSLRPAISTQAIGGEIRSYSQSGYGADDGLLRLSAGAGSSPGIMSYIDISSYSTVPDMNQNIVFGTGGQEKMRINENGNLGIGTTNPTEKLAVNGKIRAREIKVEATNWPDYVFEEGYKVETLQSLESYIKANKHLPDMPSAKEVETNGIAVSEMLKLQQKKIEELTLLLIQKDKELKKEKENNKLQDVRLTKIEAVLNIKNQ
ncbi:hypothetical protein [Pedobacter kyungheensis]|uniref:hypothetical protein n=1 Tax=Pedobacter kyungheensis TaxID=1069985 RepID=UPI00069236C2|nr:hypothetical protein [Pedobacter kyungheensis]